MKEYTPKGMKSLDKLASGCECCGDKANPAKEPVFFHSACHPEFPTWAYYEGGRVTVFCAMCTKHVITVAVQPEDREKKVPHLVELEDEDE